ncbi:GtrA family protein [bacterium]|jgi:putative flippase GtrA|nr:GtrA family protein [bacterium]MBT6832216.1 GtrA family protein [bacterium]MBT6996730.1 GtrA family protein [bacterium]MBT7772099.1 GtrA family protein [bacterium]
MQKLWQRHKKFLVQLFRYGVAGGSGAAVDIAIFSALVFLAAVDYRIAVVISFSVGTVVNFFLCAFWIFPETNLKLWTRLGRHFFSSFGGLLTNEVGLILILELFAWPHPFWAKIIATAASFFVNFVLFKYFAFNDKIRFSK